jgi:hypothetical protein
VASGDRRQASGRLQGASGRRPAGDALQSPPHGARDHPLLPQDADSLLKLAARSMFDLYAQTVQGMMVVDREHRIVWISEGYKRFLPALGFEAESEFVGHLVEEVVPNTLMAQVIETGQRRSDLASWAIWCGRSRRLRRDGRGGASPVAASQASWRNYHSLIA